MPDITLHLQEIVNMLEPLNWFFLAYFLGVNLVYIGLVVISFFYIRSQQDYFEVYKLTGLFRSELYKPVSILSPAYNEEANIIPSVEALLQIEFPDFEVIVVNDGSTDQTLEKLKDHFELFEVAAPKDLPLDHKPIKQVYRSKRYTELVVVDKVNGRKADALNAGINMARKDLICAIDADSILDSNVLLKLLRAFVENENVIAVGGIVRLANGCNIEDYIVKDVDIPDTFLGRIQSVEYLRAFLFGRVGWDYLESLLIISGAFGVFDRKAVQEVGGYLHDTVGEDMELVVRLHKHFRQKDADYSIRFLPEPVCWTEVPEDWSVLGKQRNRWQRGLADTLWRHKDMLFNPKYGRLGLLAMPYFFFVEMLGPVVELIGFLYFFAIIALGYLNSSFVLMFFSVAILLGMVLSVSAVLCEEFTYRKYPSLGDVSTLSFYALLENIGFRQIHTWWRFKGLIAFLKGDKEWGVMTRKGLQGKADNSSEETTKYSTFQKLSQVKYWAVIGIVAFLISLLIAQVLIDQQLIPDFWRFL
ncbi:glycosyltransferase [Fodinibius sp. SL11]|uniref:glycosyltransferase family 2 protein n=1 Tax=Fodinibius sp. SL11 TaxID=3425690 RepID=UPI003F883888